MVNFTAYLQVGNDFINTQAINDFHCNIQREWSDDEKTYKETSGISLFCRDGRHKFVEDITPIEFMQKCQEAEQTGFSVIA